MEEINMKAFMSGNIPKGYNISAAQTYELPISNYTIPNLLEEYNLNYR